MDSVRFLKSKKPISTGPRRAYNRCSQYLTTNVMNNETSVNVTTSHQPNYYCNHAHEH